MVVASALETCLTGYAVMVDRQVRLDIHKWNAYMDMSLHQ